MTQINFEATIVAGALVDRAVKIILMTALEDEMDSIFRAKVLIDEAGKMLKEYGYEEIPEGVRDAIHTASASIDVHYLKHIKGKVLNCTALENLQKYIAEDFPQLAEVVEFAKSIELSKDAYEKKPETTPGFIVKTDDDDEALY